MTSKTIFTRSDDLKVGGTSCCLSRAWPRANSWGGTTKFSGGTDPERVETFQDQEFRIPVQDLKRFDLYKLSGFDEARAETALNTFLARKLHPPRLKLTHEEWVSFGR
jgi:hypothetical protein